MTKNKKLTLIFIGIAFLFAFVAIFMGFAVGFKKMVDGEVVPGTTFKLFDLLFKKGGDFDDLKRRGVVIISFVALLISIILLALTGVLNLLKKSNKKANIALLSVTIVLLIVSAIIMLASNPIWGLADEHEIAGTVTKNIFGPGRIVWCVFSLISMIFAALAIDRVKKDNVVKANA